MESFVWVFLYVQVEYLPQFSNQRANLCKFNMMQPIHSPATVTWLPWWVVFIIPHKFLLSVA